MMTYTFDDALLEGVILRFWPHHDASVPTIHHTFNAIYGVDLYDTDFHFIFDNVGKNGQKELFKDAPDHLLEYMVKHIKHESGATVNVSMFPAQITGLSTWDYWGFSLVSITGWTRGSITLSIILRDYIVVM